MLKSRKKIKELENRIDELARELSRLIVENEKLKKQKETSNHDYILVVRKNKELAQKLNTIETLITCNKYNNEKVLFEKIKELVRPVNLN